MRTLGRRMQGQARLEFHTSSRPTLQLEAMNLGAVVPLSEREERFFKCHDEFGRAVGGIYAAPVRSSVQPFAVGPRVISRRSGSRQSVFSSCKAQEARNAGVCVRWARCPLLPFEIAREAVVLRWRSGLKS